MLEASCPRVLESRYSSLSIYREQGRKGVCRRAQASSFVSSWITRVARPYSSVQTASYLTYRFANQINVRIITLGSTCTVCGRTARYQGTCTGYARHGASTHHSLTRALDRTRTIRCTFLPPSQDLPYLASVCCKRSAAEWRPLSHNPRSDLCIPLVSLFEGPMSSFLPPLPCHPQVLLLT